LSRNLYDHEGNWTCQTLLDQAQAADAFQFQADLSAKYNVVGGSFVPGTAAMNYGIRGQVPDFKNVHFDLGMAALPSGVKGLVCRNGPNAFGDIDTLFVNAYKPVVKGQMTALDAMKGALPVMNADLANKISR
jgi:hypothetical protein